MTKVNYTQEMVDTAVTMYNELGNDGMDTIAETLGRSVRSVRAKLVREGVYQAPVKEVKAPVDNGPTKKEMLAYLGNKAPSVDLDGLMPATKSAIASIIELAGGSIDEIEYEKPEGAVNPETEAEAA